MLEDGEVVIFSLEGGTGKPLRSFHAEATCHELYIQSLPGEYQIDLLDHCCAWRIAKEDVAGESKHALAKSILVQTSKCSREGFNVDIHR